MTGYMERERALQGRHLYRVQEWFFQNAIDLGSHAEAAKTLLENFVLTCNVPHDGDYANFRQDLSSFPEERRELLLQGFSYVYQLSPDGLPPGTDHEAREFAKMREWRDAARERPTSVALGRYRRSPETCGGRYVHVLRKGFPSGFYRDGWTKPGEPVLRLDFP